MSVFLFPTAYTPEADQCVKKRQAMRGLRKKSPGWVEVTLYSTIL